MKRLIWGCAAALVVLCAAAPAFTMGFSMGWKAGLSSAKVSGEIEGVGSDFTWRTGFTGGLFWDFRLSKMVSIQPEFIYVQKGAWLKDTPIEVYVGPELVEGSMDTELRLWYFELPILATFTFLEKSFFSPFVCAGPVVSYTQRAIAEATISFPGYYSFGVRDDIAGDITKYDLGLAFGGGFDIDFGPLSVFFEGRYNYGVRNIDESGAGTEVKNRAITVFMGMNIPITE